MKRSLFLLPGMRDLPDGAEVQTPVALRGTCFVMRQVLFYADVQRV